MATKMFEVQQSVFQRLQSYEPLITKITGLYDFVPEKTNLPYATFGRITSQPLTSKIENGETIYITLDIWSEGKGRKEVVEILIAVEEALKEEIKLETADLVSQKITNREVWEESYGLFTGQIDIEIKTIWEEL